MQNPLSQLISQLRSHREPETSVSRWTRWVTRLVTGALAIAAIVLPFIAPERAAAAGAALASYPVFFTVLIILAVAVALLGHRIAAPRSSSEESTDDAADAGEKDQVDSALTQNSEKAEG